MKLNGHGLDIKLPKNNEQKYVLIERMPFSLLIEQQLDALQVCEPGINPSHSTFPSRSSNLPISQHHV